MVREGLSEAMMFQRDPKTVWKKLCKLSGEIFRKGIRKGGDPEA